jgi:hypothetical protein
MQPINTVHVVRNIRTGTIMAHGKTFPDACRKIEEGRLEKKNVIVDVLRGKDAAPYLDE